MVAYVGHAGEDKTQLYVFTVGAGYIQYWLVTGLELKMESQTTNKSNKNKLNMTWHMTKQRFVNITNISKFNHKQMN
jgi:hypothetical protein